MPARRYRFVDSSVGESLMALAKKSDHRALAVWAAGCAGRVLHYFEEGYPDDRPRKAIEGCREWARTGVFHMAGVRQRSLAAHAAARAAPEDSPARLAARAAGQAQATAHARMHAVAAAWYAAKAVGAADPVRAQKNVAKEREWQYRRLVRLARSAKKAR